MSGYGGGYGKPRQGPIVTTTGDFSGAVTAGSFNGIGISAAGVHDPSVTGLAAERPALYLRDTEYLPKSLAKLNEIFEPWGASFEHAYTFQDASSPALDLATSGGHSLAGYDGVVFNTSTGLTDYVTDKGIQCADGEDDGVRGADATVFDITTGSLVLLMTLRLLAAGAATRSIAGKGGGTQAYLLELGTTGKPGFLFKSTGANAGIAMPSDHTGAAYFDMMAVIDTDSASKLISLNTSVEDGGTASIAGHTTISNANIFGIGETPLRTFSASMICSFFALGFVPGTLVANRVAALAAYSSARAAGAQLWAKRGDSDTAWSKVGP